MVRYWPVIVFLGGGLGSVLRAWIGSWMPIPWGTVAINVLGSMILAALANPAIPATPELRTFVGVGMLGGFTTYSTFNLQVLTAVQDRNYGLALGQIVATVGGALVGGTLGWSAVDAWSAR